MFGSSPEKLLVDPDDFVVIVRQKCNMPWYISDGKYTNTVGFELPRRA